MRCAAARAGRKPRAGPRWTRWPMRRRHPPRRPATLHDAWSSDDPRALALHDRLDFLDVDHRRVTRRGHRERTVRGPVFHGRLRSLALEESVREAGSEAVAAAD